MSGRGRAAARALLVAGLLVVAGCGRAYPASPSSSPSIVPTQTVTATPVATPTPAPAPTATPARTFAGAVIAEGGGRVRAGPGMDQRITGLEPTGAAETFDGWYRRAGDIAQPDPASGRAEDWSRDWYHLADGRGWMHATVVSARPPAGLAQAAWEPPKPPGDPGTGRRVVISIDQQHLWALDGDRTVVDTVIATGRPELTTVTGSFKILGKYSPYLFVSPWPKSSPYWYPPSWTSYAMEFESSGYFIHDAPWRTDWGPGANLQAGSHGCVNVPLEAMRALYEWARNGDLVIVRA